MRVVGQCLLLLSLAAGAGTSVAQDAAAGAQTGLLSASQSIDFAQAKADAAAGRWTAALPVLKGLQQQHPRNDEVAKYAAEAALNTGDDAYAQPVLQHVLTGAPDDWQAHLLLARAFAQQSRTDDRDAELAQIARLHANTADAQFRQRTQFLLERIALPAGHLDVYQSLTPWSRYNIYAMGRQFDANGTQVLRITLESGDFDQPLWAKEHPKLAAAGERMFSLDGYRDVKQANGQTTQTHMTYRFFDGRPGYSTVRQLMLSVAEGKAVVQSSTSGITPK